MGVSGNRREKGMAAYRRRTSVYWDMDRVHNDPPELNCVDRGKIMMAATFTDPFSVLVSPAHDDGVRGRVSRRVKMFQFVEYKGWRYVVAGHVNVEAVQQDDGGWAWKWQAPPKRGRKKDKHGIYISLLQGGEGKIEYEQSQAGWKTFESLVAEYPSDADKAAVVQDATYFLSDHPKTHDVDPRDPVFVGTDQQDMD